MAIPTKYRERLQAISDGSMVMTIDVQDPCLLLYPIPEWEEIERKLSKLQTLDKRARRLQRLLIGHATECDLDSHGRILVPPLLREYAGLEKRAAFVGQCARFEIWNEDKWNERRQSWLGEETDDDLDLSPELQALTL